MKIQLLALALLVGFGFIAVATPAATYAISSCTQTYDVGTNSYTLTLSPCTPSGVALNSHISMTATTNDGSIVRVDFLVLDPTFTPSTYTVTGSSPFSNTIVVSAPGTWYVSATFCNAAGYCTNSNADVISFTVQILVLNALPFGAVAAASIGLLGVGVYQKSKRKQVVQESA
jgi:hypothetical protein